MAARALGDNRPMRGTTETTGVQSVLEGRIALVTGAGQGIGLEIARSLASAGAHVIVADRNRETGAVQRVVGRWPW